MSNDRKLDLSRFGGVQGTKMVPEHLDGDVAVLTIAEFAEQRNEFGEGRKLSPVLRYQECPELLHYLNRTMLEQIVEHYGDVPSQWIGKRVPVEVKDVPYENQTYRKVVISDAKDWTDIFREAGVTAGGGAAAATPTKAAVRPVVKGAKKSTKKNK